MYTPPLQYKFAHIHWYFYHEKVKAVFAGEILAKNIGGRSFKSRVSLLWEANFAREVATSIWGGTKKFLERRNKLFLVFYFLASEIFISFII